MKLGKSMRQLFIGILALTSLAVFAGGNESVLFFFSQARSTTCSEARTVYENLSNVEIYEVGSTSYDITGSLPGYSRVFIELRTTSTLGTGGFGPSNWFYYHNCRYGQY